QVATVKEARELARSLPGELSAAASHGWREVCELAQGRCAEMLQPFLEASDALASTNRDVSGEPVIPAEIPFHSGESWWRKLREARMGLMTATSMGGIAIAICPPAWPFALAGMLAATFYGWKTAETRELSQARQELSQHLGWILTRVRQHFLDVDLARG